MDTIANVKQIRVKIEMGKANWLLLMAEMDVVAYLAAARVAGRGVLWALIKVIVDYWPN